jgi:hypothetical protein
MTSTNFISVEDSSTLSTCKYLCCEPSEIYIANSYYLKIPSGAKDLLIFLSRLPLAKDELIICYDRLSMKRASRVYWALLALDFTNIKILYGGLSSWLSKDFKTSTQCSSLVLNNDVVSTPHNTQILMTSEEFENFPDRDLPHLKEINTPNIMRRLLEYSREINLDRFKQYLAEFDIIKDLTKDFVLIGENSVLVGAMIVDLHEGHLLVVMPDKYSDGNGVSEDSLYQNAISRDYFVAESIRNESDAVANDQCCLKKCEII